MTHDEAIRSGATERYLVADMPADEREAFEAHYFECLVCADDVKAAFMIRDGLRAAKPAARVLPFAARVKKATAPLAAAASLVLASLLGWVQFVRVPALNSARIAALQPQEPIDYALEATRGEPEIVEVSKAPINLKVSVPVDAGVAPFSVQVIDARREAMGRAILTSSDEVTINIGRGGLPPGGYAIRMSDAAGKPITEVPITVR